MQICPKNIDNMQRIVYLCIPINIYIHIKVSIMNKKILLFLIAVVSSLTLCCSCDDDENDEKVIDEYYVRYTGYCEITGDPRTRPRFFINVESGKQKGFDRDEIDVTVGPVQKGFVALINCMNWADVAGHSFIQIDVSKNGAPFVTKGYKDIGTSSTDFIKYTIE